MAIVTGDRYLDLLSRFIEGNAGSLLDGGLILKLNPVGLHYVQARLDALQELEALRLGAPVDYLRAYVADLGDHRALEQLRRVLRLLGSVKVVAVLPAPTRDPTPITLLPFSRLRSLELRGCDLSTSSARGLLELRPILETLVCYNSADALRHIFAERTAEIQGAQVWSRLTNVSCIGNGMLLMDDSLQLLPVVEALDLSRNRFAKVANLQKCTKLNFLDVGFNHITTVESVNQILHGVTKLVLRNNALVSTRGLQRMASLEALDLSYNLISSFREVELLGKLQSLRFLWLEGNPVTFSRFYRKEALSYFSDPVKLTLDGKQTTRRENWAAGRIVAHRLKQRSKYGAFTPAQTDESSVLSLSGSGDLSDIASKDGTGPTSCKVRKKMSRLASIQDLSGLQIASREAEVAQEGSGFDTDTSAGQEISEAKEQVEETVQDLMQQTEVLKRAGSSTWLKDLNVLFENKVRNKSKIERQQRYTNLQGPSWQKVRRRRSSRKGSLLVPNSVSKDSDGRTIIEENTEAGQHFAALAPESNVRLMSTKALAGVGSGDGGVEILPAVTSLPTAVSLDESLLKSSTGAEHPYGLPAFSDIASDSLDEGVETFKLSEELVMGKMSVSSASSPPQFNQDVLHRRQNLEKELMQLPTERESSPLYDSESSSETTIYSHSSDSSDSLYHSPASIWHPFSLAHGFRDLELPSGKDDKEDTLFQWIETGVPGRETSESGEHVQLDPTYIRTRGNTEEACDSIVGDSGSGVKVDSPRKVTSSADPENQKVADSQKENCRGDSEQSNYGKSGLLQGKLKPSRRVVHLESMPDLSATIHGHSETPSRNQDPHTESKLPKDRQNWAFSSDINSPGEQEIQVDSVTSSSLSKGESHKAPDGTLYFHRVHAAVRQFVDQCA